MAQCIKGGGVRTNHKEWEGRFIRTETYTKDFGRMTKLTDLECTFILMELSTKETGLRISNTDKVKKRGPMVLYMKGIIRTERKMVLVLLIGLMEQLLLGLSKIIRLMEKVSIHGQMVEST